jgi:4-amino-4-deoxy-L-arabinose transferase-like glycosyltransferase
MLLVAVAALSWLLVSTHAGTLGFTGLTRRASFVIAFALHQVITVAITEIASIGRHLTATSVTLAWVAVLLIGTVLCRRALVDGASSLVRAVRAPSLRRPLPPVDGVVAALVLTAFLGALLAQGLLYRPANSDAKLYHLPRVEHWIQNETVAPYAAHFLAQIELAPLSAYQFVSLHLVTGTDRWDGYVELTGAVVCVVGVSELARRLGLSGRGQAFAALLAATVPNLVLEATSATNNLFGAAIGVAALVVLTSGPGRGGWTRRGIALGAVAGLAELSKGTLVALIGPAALVLVVVAIHRRCRVLGPVVVLRQCVGAGFFGALAGGLVAGPFLYRNFELFGGPGGPVTASTIVTDPSIAGAASNVARSGSAQFLVGGQDGVLHTFSAAMIGLFRHLYDVVGAVDSRNYVLDPLPNPFESGDFSVTTRFEDVGANPWHVLLMIVSLVLLAVCVLRGRRDLVLPLALAVALCVGFVIFAATARWSIYASRYYLPLLVLWCPVIVLALAQLRPRRLARAAARGVAVLLVVACLPMLLDNFTRPLIHPDWRHGAPLEAYFALSGSDDGAPARASAASYADLTAAVAHSSCDRLGLANIIISEYAVWTGLKRFDWDGTIQDVGVDNVSRSLAPAGFVPCAVVFDSLSVHVSAPSAPESVEGLVATRFGTLTLFLDPATVPPA